ncbi:MAG: hypothetical protein COU10_00685 [Candidatus Harrisonbacteria bacterium CG10_big_fil_rev_8_21_14_0_10_45_28]|uniref:Rod shape-determining protein MreD n=1 Tax=Candidatus Harrisonbacteria bacterium CG10_big_fil_rev_8_21_14_0_10_45_28 TaxID=1974586 RepID=A0A2H0UR83_9BACT|nr:MAG: hypothetical protein COU10_00685 [Candidatus Harrisonbacteria bacterium CG10_big_fil_rev_8_21_14_0_10_45_28]
MQRVLEKLGVGIVLLVLVILAVSLQGEDFFTWFGIKPNLVLGVLVASVLVLDWVWYGSLLIIGALGLEFYPGVGMIAVALMGTGILNFWLSRKFLAESFFAIFILGLAGTVTFYLILSPSYILSYPARVLVEAVYNLIIGGLIFGTLRYLNPTQ